MAVYSVKNIEMLNVSDDEELTELLLEEWEPYAVTADGHGVVTHHLRRVDRY